MNHAAPAMETLERPAVDRGRGYASLALHALAHGDPTAAARWDAFVPVSYTHLTLPTSDLV